MLLVTLHGFWGRGQDLKPVAEKLLAQNSQWQCWAPDIFIEPQLSPENNFTTWSCHFNAQVKQRSQGASVVAMGYSLGGRLLLHALFQSPQLYRSAVLLSAHPGLTDRAEIDQRLQWENLWKKKFLEQPWRELWKEWNSQAVLANSKWNKIPAEKGDIRHKLAMALEKWSPTRHQVSREEISRGVVPLLWIAGKRDEKYVRLYQNLAANTTLLPDAGHRLHLDRPDELARIVSQFFHT